VKDAGFQCFQQKDGSSKVTISVSPKLRTVVAQAFGILSKLGSTDWERLEAGLIKA